MSTMRAPRSGGFLNGLRFAGLVVLALIGFGGAGAAVGVAFLLPHTSAVVLAACGSAVGTLLVGLALPRLFALARATDRPRLEADLERDRALTEAEREIAHLQAESQRRQLEIERLRGTRLGIEGFERVHKLSLLRVSTVVSDIVQRDLDHRAGGRVVPGRTTEYVGALQKHVDGHFGVNLDAVRVRDDGDAIVVSGVAAEFHGFIDTREEWKLKEVRVRTEGGLWPASYQIDPNSPLLADETIRQREELTARVRSGIDFGFAAPVIEGLAREHIDAFLRPLGRPIRFVTAVDADGVPLRAFADAHNARVEAGARKALPSGDATQ